MAVKAYLKNARISPRKAGIVAALVRGRSVEDALVILENTPRRSAQLIRKTVASAKANAEHNHGLKPDTLSITTISVTPGLRIKRWRPVAYGRANPFQRKTSNILVIVDGEQRSTVKASEKAAGEAKKETK